MKEKIKTLLCSVLVFGATLSMGLFAGCDVQEGINQLKCKHEYGAVTVIEASTCSKKGKGEKTCTLCEKVETVALDLREHNLEQIARVDPTCTKAGTEEYTKCRDCGYTEKGIVSISPTGHKVVKDEGKEATCLENGLTAGEHCDVCGEVLLEQKEIVATGHVVVAVPEKSATCTEAGQTAGEACKKCGEVYSGCEEIPMTEHEYDEDGTCKDCGADQADE